MINVCFHMNRVRAEVVAVTGHGQRAEELSLAVNKAVERASVQIGNSFCCEKPFKKYI